MSADIILKLMLWFPPGQRRGSRIAATVNALRVCREHNLFPLLVLAVRVVHSQCDEGGGLSVVVKFVLSKVARCMILQVFLQSVSSSSDSSVYLA